MSPACKYAVWSVTNGNTYSSQLCGVCNYGHAFISTGCQPASDSIGSCRGSALLTEPGNWSRRSERVLCHSQWACEFRMIHPADSGQNGSIYNVPVPTFALSPTTSAVPAQRTPPHCPNECFPGFLGTASRPRVFRSLRISPTFSPRGLPGTQALPRKFIDPRQHPNRSSIVRPGVRPIGVQYVVPKDSLEYQ